MFWCMDTAKCKFVPTMREVLKWLTPLPPLMQNHSGGDSVALGIDHPPFPPPRILAVPISTSSETTY